MANDLLKELFENERRYINDFFEKIDHSLVEQTLNLLLSCKGLIICTGVGKSGLIAKKLAVTLTSTGTRAIFLSPTNALHGDLGILKPEDLFLIFSKSGESEELLNLIPFIRNRKVPIVAMLANSKSRLAKAVDHTLILPEVKELCPFDMAPTTSTTVQLIVGDILAMALMRQKKISLGEFTDSHPAGRLGKRSILKVSDLMLKEDSIPVCAPQDRLMSVLFELSRKQCGCVLVRDASNKLLGIFTDGDLRRALEKRGAEALECQMQELMIRSPRMVHPETLVQEALKKMESDQKQPITVLPVLDAENQIVGILKMHDILQSGI